MTTVLVVVDSWFDSTCAATVASTALRDVSVSLVAAISASTVASADSSISAWVPLAVVDPRGVVVRDSVPSQYFSTALLTASGSPRVLNTSVWVFTPSVLVYRIATFSPVIILWRYSSALELGGSNTVSVI